MRRSCLCGQDFDDDVNYEGRPRIRGPRRGSCTLTCSKKFQNQDFQYARRTALRTRYGISLEEYEALLDGQGGRCAICGAVETTVHSSGTVYNLAVDHDHKTGQIRGLLCTPCNRGIGFLRDDRELLRLAIYYLEARP